MKRSFIVLILVLTAAVLFISCGSDSSPALVKIEVTPAGQTVLETNTQQYTATGTYSDGGTRNLTTSVVWMSSNETAATIDTNGLLTAHSAGAGGTISITVTATMKEISGSTSATILCLVC